MHRTVQRTGRRHVRPAGHQHAHPPVHPRERRRVNRLPSGNLRGCLIVSPPTFPLHPGRVQAGHPVIIAAPGAAAVLAEVEGEVLVEGAPEVVVAEVVAEDVSRSFRLKTLCDRRERISLRERAYSSGISEALMSRTTTYSPFLLSNKTI